MNLEELRRRGRQRAAQRDSETPPSKRQGSRLRTVFEQPQELQIEYVRNTKEFKRVFALPRTDWQARPDLDELIDVLSEGYKTPQGSWRLRPVQAVLLETLADSGGCFGLVGVGEGKTLASFLAPLVTEAKRPLLLVPAKLIEKTRIEFEDLAEHWQSGEPFTMKSYEWLGRAQAADWLESFKPDLIVADEAHRLKNRGASVTRRFLRYCIEHDPKLLAMSGTLASRSLMDFHHLLALCLGPDTMPLPFPQAECRVWAQAVDEKVRGRARPGAFQFHIDGKATLHTCRKLVGDRIRQTSGVIGTTQKAVDASIRIEIVKPALPDAVRTVLQDMWATKRSPDGTEASPMDMARHTGTLSCGFYYRWDPLPPGWWLGPRSNWGGFVRHILDLEDPRFDSELQIANGVRSGALEDGGALESWTKVRKSFEPNSVAVWLSDELLQFAAKRIGKGIAWVQHRAAGYKLAEIADLPFFHRKGQDDAGNSIERHKGPAVLSIAANDEGRNLQRYSHNVICSSPASGRSWEQLLGRTHRKGQTADEITVDILAPITTSPFEQACSDARFISATTGQPQKLLLADIINHAP